MTLFDGLPDLPDELVDELCAECNLDIEHCQCAEGFAVIEDPEDEGDELDEDEGDELDMECDVPTLIDMQECSDEAPIERSVMETA